MHTIPADLTECEENSFDNSFDGAKSIENIYFEHMTLVCWTSADIKWRTTYDRTGLRDTVHCVQCVVVCSTPVLNTVLHTQTQF